MSSEHVEVLRHMKETIKAIAPSEVAALDAAIASLSAPQPPAEAQPVAWADAGTSEEVMNVALLEGSYGCRVPLYAAPPSAPVGVEDWLIGDLMEAEEGGHTAHTPAELCGLAAKALKSLIAQQPAADGGFTAADMMDARQEGRKEAKQPAAVDEAMVERALSARAGSWSVRQLFADEDEAPDIMRIALTAALAAQQGGGS